MMTFAYRRSPDQDAASPIRHPVVIIGAGPVGLSLAIDLAQRGIKVVLLDDADRIGEGSRAICFAKKTLEIFDRLGCADAMLEVGVRWSVGRVFQRDKELYRFDLLPEGGHRMPAFINIQQYHVERILAARAQELPNVELRWLNKVVEIEHLKGGAQLTIETPDGRYTIETDWLIACDGARSPSRSMLGLSFKGEVFEDQFLIADVKMKADFPVERWFWFDPPFHAGQSALLHKQPNDIWRIDLQLPADVDTTEEKKPANVIPRIEAMLGHSNFELEWVSIYRFQCRRLEAFRHGRVVFAGDSAHQVSPFGARGANSGVQDAENLAWKLAYVLQGKADERLIDTYHSERSDAADENILHSTRSTDFIAPHGPAERRLRNAALALATKTDFAKRMVNSGRLSLPHTYLNSPLSTADQQIWVGGPAPGQTIPDAVVMTQKGEKFLTTLLGPDMTVLAGRNCGVPDLNGVCILQDGKAFEDQNGHVKDRFHLPTHGLYLIRPDGHVALRQHSLDMMALRAGLARAGMANA
jgi:3-(3-hydroxy-phenyl)propionate hydroxylase